MSLFLTIALVHLLAVAMPGPDFLFVSQTAVSRSRGQALAGVAGIALGVAVWAALALLGLEVLLQRLAWLQRLIALAGGLYLLWMGVQSLRSAWRGGAGTTVSPVLQADAWRSLRAGLLTNLANPKAMVYFASVFSALVGPGVGMAVRWEIWSMVVVESLLWFALVAACFGLPSVRRAYLRMGRAIDAVAGTVFVLFGLRLVGMAR